jgi:hypothetical protein
MHFFLFSILYKSTQFLVWFARMMHDWHHWMALADFGTSIISINDIFYDVLPTTLLMTLLYFQIPPDKQVEI